MKKILINIGVLIIILFGGGCKEKSQLSLTVGQVWKYNNRKEETNSRVHILGLVNYFNKDKKQYINMYLIKIDKLKPDDHGNSKYFIMIDEKNLRKSITEIDTETKFEGVFTNFHVDILNMWTKSVVNHNDVIVDADIMYYLKENW